MTELLEIRKCLDLATWRTLSILCEYLDERKQTGSELAFSVQLSTDRIATANDLFGA